jgi:protein-L-isoaspartate(D-aspartate) O-methyltransferase
LSRLASSVDSIERFPTLSQKSEAVLRQLNITNVTVHLGDGSVGLEKNAPYDAIIVTAAAPVISPILLGQLKIEGRLVVPVGDYAGVQKLVRVTRRDGSTYDHEEIIDVRFVPLVGQEGFSS